MVDPATYFQHMSGESAVRRVLEEGVARGIIDISQRDALLGVTQAIEPTQKSGEAPEGFSPVNVAYALGAVCVLVGSAWFLVGRWDSLGASGVLAVSVAYALGLLALAARVERIGFVRAARVARMLSVALTPLIAWSVLSLVGQWPSLASHDPRWNRASYRASRYAILEFSTLSAAFALWRYKRSPELVYPVAIALWGLWFHTGHVAQGDRLSTDADLWNMLADGLMLLAAAHTAEQWQRTPARRKEGDFALPWWVTGLVAFSVAFMALWLRHAYLKHALAPVGAAFLTVGLLVRRRVVAFVGFCGVVGYLVYLATEVFKGGPWFPLALAVVGGVTLGTTVWAQKRFPSILRRPIAGPAVPPWPVFVSWVPVALAVAVAIWYSKYPTAYPTRPPTPSSLQKPQR